MPDKPTEEPATSRREALSAYLDRHPILAAVAVLLPALVAAYLQLRSGMVDIEQKQENLDASKADAVETDNVEAKAGQLEARTRKTQGQIAMEIQRLRESLSRELGTVYGDVASLTQAVERLSARLDLIEAETVDPEERLRNEARVLFPDLNVDEMNPAVLQRLVDLIHGEGAGRLPPRRDKPRVETVQIQTQEPAF